MKLEFHLTKQQQLACALYEKNDSEITIKAATGFGKTVVLTKNLEKETRSIVVFPSINLINQYIGNNKQNKYMPHLSHRKNIFTYFTEKNEITDQMNLDFKTIKQVQKNLETQKDILCITTYNSLPMVLKHLKEKINIHFDEAHHRRRETVKESLGKYHNKIHRIINYSATPSDECQGEIFRYSLKQAIDDGVVRDFDIHYLIGTTNDKKNMLKYIKQISNETGNRKCMVFTGLSEVESENKHNVNKLVKQWKKQNTDKTIWIEGIIGSEKADDRMKKMKAFENHNGIALLVSCRTMKEGVDLKGANCVIFMDAVKSSEVIVQNIGRVLRPYRDDDGTILANQPKATVLLNVFIDKEEYDSYETDEEKDLFIRNTGETKSGSFGMILNVVSALKEDDDEWEEFLLNYPSGLKIKDNNLKNDGKSKIDYDSDSEFDSEIDYDSDSEFENNDNLSPLQKAGFEVGDVPADGNCFFHCAEKIINVPHEEIRNSIKEYADNHRDELTQLGINDKDIDTIGDDGEWNSNMGDLVPRIFTEIYRIPIAIHNVDGTVRERYGEGDDENVCHHLLLHNDHYSPLTINADTNSNIKSEIKHKAKPDKRKFIGHVADEMKILWNGDEDVFNGLLMRLQYRIDGKNLNDERWDQVCDRLIEFLNKHNGKKRPSNISDDDDERYLGKWVSTQVTTYKQETSGMVNPERRKKWEKVLERFPVLKNKDWEQIWNQYLYKLTKFMEKNNGEKRPSDRSDDEEEKFLGHWVSDQNTNYITDKGGMKDRERRIQWEDLRERFPILKGLEDKWDQTCDHLIKFMEDNNAEDRRPSSHSNDKNEKFLGSWVQTQNKNYKNHRCGMVDVERRKKWESILERFPILKEKDSDEFWDKNLKKLEVFLVKNEGKRRPSNVSDDKDEKYLGKWVSIQITTYNRDSSGRINSEQKKKWKDLCRKFPILNYKDWDQIWGQNLKKLTMFMEKNSGKKRPSDNSDDEEEKFLSHWVTDQNTNYNSNRRSMRNLENRKQWEDLRKKFPILKGLEDKWDQTCDHLIKFMEDNNAEDRRPSSHSNDKNEKFLGSWVQTQNKNYKNHRCGMVDVERRKKWESILERFPILKERIVEEEWGMICNELIVFMNQNSGNRRPNILSVNENEKFLGRWVSQQHNQYKHHTCGMINAERRKKWESILENFPILKEKNFEEEWEQNYDSLITFIEGNNENKLPSKRSMNENEKFLGMWVGTQKHKYKNPKGVMKNCDYRNKWENLVETYPKAFGDYVEMMRQIRDSVVPTTDNNDGTTIEQSVESSSDTESVSTISMASINENTNVSTCEYENEDRLENMTKEDLLVLYRNLKQKQQTNSRAYTAPNPKSKEDINKILTQYKPQKGLMIVLDHTDFKTSSLLDDLARTIVPQRDIEAFNKMKQHEKFGKCVVNKDLLDYLKELPKKEKISLIYADLMGSIKEAIPILDELTGRVRKGSVVAITISCRDGEQSLYTNSFATKLVMEMGKRFPKYVVLTPDDLPIVYGEHVRMATLIIRLQ